MGRDRDARKIEAELRRLLALADPDHPILRQLDQTVEADHPQALEPLAAYILGPSFASTRVRYLAGSGQVHYRTAKGVA